VHDIIAELPQKRQSLFFSATMPPAIVKLSQDILNDPVKVAVTPPATTVDLIQQKLYYVDKYQKLELLRQLLDDPRITSALVFTRTKRGADVVARSLEQHGISAEAIHGNKAQNRRQKSLTNFKTGAIRVLVASDIAARGIDIDNLEYVFNYEIPNIPETYVHRIGRTGRAGANGIAISFCAPDEKAYIKDIEKLTRVKIPVEHHNLGKPEPRQSEQSKPHQDRERKQHPGRRVPKKEHGRPLSERPRGEHPGGERRRSENPRGERPNGAQPRGERPHNDNPRARRPQSERPNSDRQRGEHNRDDRPKREHRDNSQRPQHPQPNQSGAPAKKSGKRRWNKRRRNG
jgi:ATP-dependent RNA helicase RhlE